MTDDTRLRLVEQYRLAIGIPNAPCTDKSNTDLASTIVGFALNAFMREIESTPDLKPWPDADWREAYNVLTMMAKQLDEFTRSPVVDRVAIIAGVPVEDLKRGLSRCPHEVAAVLGHDTRPSQLGLGKDSGAGELDDAWVLEYVAGEVRKLSADLDGLPADLQRVAWSTLAYMSSHRRNST